ncbi:MAG: hypothetical protein EOL97_09860 [Spirochaetia bacterium]|nr:hypothetical protein [Spirochaetia bacterium]
MSELSIEEQIILANLNTRYKYLTRDLNDELTLWTTKPNKNKQIGKWIGNGDYYSFDIYKHIFKSICFEDDSPFKISELY